MATTVSTSAPAGLSPKARRAWERLAEHEQRMAVRRGGVQTYYCGGCNEAMFSYVPPVGMVVERCRKCGDWQKFTTEQP